MAIEKYVFDDRVRKHTRHRTTGGENNPGTIKWLQAHTEIRKAIERNELPKTFDREIEHLLQSCRAKAKEDAIKNEGEREYATSLIILTEQDRLTFRKDSENYYFAMEVLQVLKCFRGMQRAIERENIVEAVCLAAAYGVHCENAYIRLHSDYLLSGQASAAGGRRGGQARRDDRDPADDEYTMEMWDAFQSCKRSNPLMSDAKAMETIAPKFPYKRGDEERIYTVDGIRKRFRKAGLLNPGSRKK